MGFISIFGIAIQDALIVVTYASGCGTTGCGLEEGARDAAERRLRPVLMTTFVAMIGLMPAALSHGIGSETQKPLAIVVIGGALILAILPRLLQPRAAGAGPRRRAPLARRPPPEARATPSSPNRGIPLHRPPRGLKQLPRRPEQAIGPTGAHPDTEAHLGR